MKKDYDLLIFFNEKDRKYYVARKDGYGNKNIMGEIRHRTIVCREEYCYEYYVYSEGGHVRKLIKDVVVGIFNGIYNIVFKNKK